MKFEKRPQPGQIFRLAAAKAMLDVITPAFEQAICEMGSGSEKHLRRITVPRWLYEGVVSVAKLDGIQYRDHYPLSPGQGDDFVVFEFEWTEHTGRRHEVVQMREVLDG